MLETTIKTPVSTFLSDFAFLERLFEVRTIFPNKLYVVMHGLTQIMQYYMK